MSVDYRGKTPERNYNLSDFYKNGVVISWFAKFKTSGIPQIRIVFRSNGLLGEIRTCGDGFAVDAWWGWSTNQRQCLTTECKSVREAKSILFEWFKSKGFVVSKKVTDHDWRKGTLAYYGVQLSLNPFIKGLA
jgi:hypothetical protein